MYLYMYIYGHVYCTHKICVLIFVLICVYRSTRMYGNTLTKTEIHGHLSMTKTDEYKNSWYVNNPNSDLNCEDTARA